MFYIIGLGLGDSKDITVKGLEILKTCNKVYLEAYTSILTCGTDVLEEFYGKKLIIADRDLLSETLLGLRHTQIFFLRAKEKQIKVQVIHNASILNAIGCCGLQLYSFGETISIPYWTDTWKPDNIKVKEPTLESLTKKKKEYMPPKFMSVSEASQQLLYIIRKIKENGETSVIGEDSSCVGVARVGSEDQKIVFCSLREMSEFDLGGPLHSLVLVGPVLHPMETEFLQQFRI
ncbi:hypothetical protein NQ317_001356 [Molorchus minor]|uniref:diphthine methyl ester synthase n=1 Tax=Molorchus minor TaxID=1323400 RepID=A0ABQ9JNZ2_9CUCU|nr:hypothetical protein NQ317_001356 [Molorchus minor]